MTLPESRLPKLPQIGNKIWLNGGLLIVNHVYHAGTYIDQYVIRGRLKAGKNVILLKIAQNEETDSWRRTGNSSSASAINPVPRSCLRIADRSRCRLLRPGLL